MNFKVGVFTKGKLESEAVVAAKNALKDIALKYKCSFELSRAEQAPNPTNTSVENPINANSSNQTSVKKGVFLSFCGELEID